ncbi:MAG: helix-turn-helix domain-containing protein [Eubacteriales bacterium]
MDKSPIIERKGNGMHTVSYYSDINDVDNNFADSSVYLRVNCTGRAVYGDAVGRSVRQDFYLIYLIKGEIVIRSPAVERSMNSGDLMIFASGTPFDYTGLAAGELIYYWVHFTGYAAGQLIENCGFRVNTVERVGLSEEIPGIFSELFAAFTRLDGLTELDKSRVLMGLLIALGRQSRRNAGGTGGHSRKSSVIRRSVRYIHENISLPLTVESLAEREFMSPSRYRELFRAVMGTSPKDYIINLRINIACDMLLRSEMSVGEIAAAVGFSDGRYFSRIFMRRIGKTPTEYQKTLSLP